MNLPFKYSSFAEPLLNELSLSKFKKKKKFKNEN